MPEFLAVPWVRWKRHRITGIVRERGSERPLSGLMVNALDKDIIKDDFLGQCETDSEGRFEIHFTDAEFKDFNEEKPDIYLCVYEVGRATPVHDTSYEIRQDASDDEYFEIGIPAADLRGGA